MLSAGKLTLTGVIGLVGAILGVRSQLPPKTVDRPLAIEYLDYYYGHVEPDPSKCCYDLLDDRYHEAHNQTKASYVAFFRRYSKIDVGRVTDNGDGHFTALLTYHFPDGRVSAPEKTRFQLECTGMLDRLPGISCGREDVRMHDSQGPYSQ